MDLYGDTQPYTLLFCIFLLHSIACLQLIQIFKASIIYGCIASNNTNS
uniref:Uncharacterized protein n=1 Tax=Arundo donax TaxID=35708 RepID=A0A0A9FUW2_ARUDO